MLKPTQDLISFKWIPPIVGKIIIARETFQYDKCKVGKYFIGEVKNIGPLVKDIKIDDHILVHEFSPKNVKQEWKEDKLYFVKEIEIKALIIDKKFTGFIERIISEEQKDRILQEE